MRRKYNVCKVVLTLVLVVLAFLSTYTSSIIYATSDIAVSDADSIAKARTLYDKFVKYVDPNWLVVSETDFMNDYICNQSQEKLQYIKSTAQDIVKDKTTQVEKISAVAEYLAQNIYYDYDALAQWGITSTTNYLPYDILKNEYTVCSGYAHTFQALMQALAIPCVCVESNNHEFNAVYTGERWMLLDTTWMSNNTYKEGIKTKGEMDYEWYDFTIDQAVSDYYHIILDMEYNITSTEVIKVSKNCKTYKFTIPEGIKSIGYYAFVGCDGIQNIEIPNSVTSIGEAAFLSCKGITSIKIPNSVVSIGNKAFYYCTGITSIDLPNSVTSIGDFAFPAGIQINRIGFVTKNFKAKQVGYNSISLRWSKTAEAQGYEVYRAVSKNGEYSFIQSTKKVAFTDTYLKTGKTYYYKIRPYVNVGSVREYGQYSNVISGKTVPGVPLRLTVKKSSSQKAKITWNLVKGASGYEIKYSKANTKKFKRLTQSKGNYYTAKLKSKTKYYFKVRAYRKVGTKKVYGKWSVVKKISM